MSRNHLVRVGVLSHVGRFRAVDWRPYPRGSRVVCRTERGLEVGEVLATANDDGNPVDGDLLRPLSSEDELLLERLERHREEACSACERLLQQRGISAALMDVEQTFDGQSLFFYFLGETSAELQQVTEELAEAYEAKVQFRKFAETLEQGCGPDCGTEDATGCVTGCASCVVAEACGKRE